MRLCGGNSSTSLETVSSELSLRLDPCGPRRASICFAELGAPPDRDVRISAFAELGAPPDRDVRISASQNSALVLVGGLSAAVSCPDHTAHVAAIRLRGDCGAFPPQTPPPRTRTSRLICEPVARTPVATASASGLRHPSTTRAKRQRAVYGTRRASERQRQRAAPEIGRRIRPALRAGDSTTPKSGGSRELGRPATRHRSCNAEPATQQQRLLRSKPKNPHTNVWGFLQQRGPGSQKAVRS